MFLEHWTKSSEPEVVAGELSQLCYAIEGPVMERAIIGLLKSGSEFELHERYANWGVDSDI